eukprot:TRINITY_DN5604_c0_g1_i18.p2 TRINITY_DN5604_c0_g1~~TRINITY_DN5604_c0_g1_i18.p2  ORF type:complete len:346 (-),score=64.32 TRINITY_DN5604_c0_g1_i18:1490-2527(-)
MDDQVPQISQHLQNSHVTLLSFLLEKQTYSLLELQGFEIIYVVREEHPAFSKLSNKSYSRVVTPIPPRTSWAYFCDVGAISATGNYLFFLSPSVLVPNGADLLPFLGQHFKTMVISEFSDPRVALIGPKILDSQGLIYSTGIEFHEVKVEGQPEPLYFPFQRFQGFFRGDKRSSEGAKTSGFIHDGLIINSKAFWQVQGFLGSNGEPTVITPKQERSWLQPLYSTGDDGGEDSWFQKRFEGGQKISDLALVAASLSLAVINKEYWVLYVPEFTLMKDCKATTTGKKSVVGHFLSASDVTMPSLVAFNHLWGEEGKQLLKPLSTIKRLGYNVVWDFPWSGSHKDLT